MADGEDSSRACLRTWYLVWWDGSREEYAEVTDEEDDGAEEEGEGGEEV